MANAVTNNKDLKNDNALRFFLKALSKKTALTDIQRVVPRIDERKVIRKEYMMAKTASLYRVFDEKDPDTSRPGELDRVGLIAVTRTLRRRIRHQEALPLYHAGPPADWPRRLVTTVIISVPDDALLDITTLYKRPGFDARFVPWKTMEDRGVQLFTCNPDGEVSILTNPLVTDDDA